MIKRKLNLTNVCGFERKLCAERVARMKHSAAGVIATDCGGSGANPLRVIDELSESLILECVRKFERKQKY